MRDFAVIPIERLLRRKGKCPLSLPDEKGNEYCAVEGKIPGINPLTGNDPAYTGCGGNILDCPYDDSKTEAALTEAALREKKNYIETVLKDEIGYLEKTIGDIKQKRFQI